MIRLLAQKAATARAFDDAGIQKLKCVYGIFPTHTPERLSKGRPGPPTETADTVGYMRWFYVPTMHTCWAVADAKMLMVEQ